MNTLARPDDNLPDPQAATPYFSATADWLTEKLVEAWCRTAARIARVA
jgi:hypothetical protein